MVYLLKHTTHPKGKVLRFKKKHQVPRSNRLQGTAAQRRRGAYTHRSIRSQRAAPLASRRCSTSLHRRSHLFSLPPNSLVPNTAAGGNRAAHLGTRPRKERNCRVAREESGPFTVALGRSQRSPRARPRSSGNHERRLGLGA
jgi:hypothetical protein